MAKLLRNTIHEKIYEIRGKKVILDADLAILYNVETRKLNQAVRRNLNRFPEDFFFQLTFNEWQSLISQNVISSWGGRRTLPLAFTEHGIAMLASILKSEIAVAMNIAIIHTFIALRNIQVDYSGLLDRITQLEETFHRKFTSIDQALDFLLHEKQKDKEQKNRKKIGFLPENKKNKT